MLPAPIQFVIILQIEQFDVATNGNRDNGIADISEFASRISARDARRDQVSVEVTAVRALHRSRRIVFRQEKALHLPGLQRLQNPPQARDSAPVGFGEIQGFAGFRSSLVPKSID